MLKSPNSRIVGVYAEVGAGFLTTPLTSIGVEGVQFVGIDRDTGRRISAFYVGATFSVGASLRNVTAGTGVFAFTGPPERMGGWSGNIQLSSVLTSGVGVNLDGDVLAFAGLNSSIGATVGFGGTPQVYADGELIYDYGDVYDDKFVMNSGAAFDAAMISVANSGSGRTKNTYDLDDGFIAVERWQRLPGGLEAYVTWSLLDEYGNRVPNVVAKNHIQTTPYKIDIDQNAIGKPFYDAYQKYRTQLPQPIKLQIPDELLDGTESEALSIDIPLDAGSLALSEFGQKGVVSGNNHERLTGDAAKSHVNIVKANANAVAGVESRQGLDEGRAGESEQADVLTDPPKVLNAVGSLQKAGPRLSNPSENPERRTGDRRSVVAPSSRVPQYQAKLDALATAKPTPPERSPLWPDKSIKNIADAGAYLFEILNSPTPAELREKQKPVVYPKFPTSNRDRGEAADEIEALMRLMMPAKEKNHPPFPVPLAEIARVLLQPRP